MIRKRKRRRTSKQYESILRAIVKRKATRQKIQHAITLSSLHGKISDHEAAILKAVNAHSELVPR